MNHRTDLLLIGLQAAQLYINRWAYQKGFWDLPEELERIRDGQASFESKEALERLVKSQKLMLMVSELSELLEHLRKPAEAKVAGFSNEEEELADLVIRALDYAGQYNLRLGEAIIAKMEVNEGRPHRHGKNF